MVVRCSRVRLRAVFQGRVGEQRRKKEGRRREKKEGGRDKREERTKNTKEVEEQQQGRKNKWRWGGRGGGCYEGQGGTKVREGTTDRDKRIYIGSVRVLSDTMRSRGEGRKEAQPAHRPGNPNVGDKGVQLWPLLHSEFPTAGVHRVQHNNAARNWPIAGSRLQPAAGQARTGKIRKRLRLQTSQPASQPDQPGRPGRGRPGTGTGDNRPPICRVGASGGQARAIDAGSLRLRRSGGDELPVGPRERALGWGQRCPLPPARAWVHLYLHVRTSVFCKHLFIYLHSYYRPPAEPGCSSAWSTA